MNTKTARLDQAFLDTQRGKLTKLRNEILSATQSLESERSGINAEAVGEPREYEEDGQRLASIELEENLTEASSRRLASVDRALQKIEDGTYGLSDGNGESIPMERLEATPDALYTVEEQSTRDAGR